MDEDTLHVELPEVTGEASNPRNPRPRARPVPLYDRIEPLRLARDPEVDRHPRLVEFETIHQDYFANAFLRAPPAPEIPGVHLPRPQLDIPHLRPAGAAEHLQDAQGAPQPRGEGLRRLQEDIWVQQRRLVQQQRVLAGRVAGHNLRNPRPAALPDAPIHPIPRPRGNGAGGVRMDRGRVDQWRREVPGPGDGAAL